METNSSRPIDVSWIIVPGNGYHQRKLNVVAMRPVEKTSA